MPEQREKRRIVMVEDEPDFQTVVHGWLAPEYEHIPLADGEELIKRLEVFAPDLVIMDVRLPGPDGFELCRRIRKDPGFAEVPVLFLTGSQDAEDFLKNFQVGGTSYLRKPVSRQQLLSAVRQLLPGPREIEEEESVGTGD